jgi:hypothetical protein
LKTAAIGEDHGSASLDHGGVCAVMISKLKFNSLAAIAIVDIHDAADNPATTILR